MPLEIENIITNPPLSEASTAMDIEDFNYEKIFSDTKTALIKNIQLHYPQLNELSESDPMMKTLQIAAYRELLIRQKIKDTLKSSLISRASGKNVAQLSQLILEKDEIENKTDREIKTSLLNFWKKTLYYTTGTAVSYKYFTQEVDKESIRDSRSIKEKPAEIKIYLLLEKGHRLTADAEADLLKKTKNYLCDPKICRITDKIEVEYASIQSYSLTADIELFPNYRLEAIKPTIEKMLAKITDSRFYLDKALDTKYFFKAFYQQGVKNVSLKIVTETTDLNKDTSLPANPKQAYRWDNTLQIKTQRSK